MAEDKKNDSAGWLARAKQVAKELFSGATEADTEIRQADSQYGYDAVSVSVLLGSGKRAARNRFDIYSKWHYMAGDPIIASALNLHVTMALGGHETTGDTVFIECKPDAEKDKGKKKIVEELNADLTKIFNAVAHPVAFNAVAFGDSYARAYTKEKVGIVDLYTDEMVFPPLVQSYERGNKTVGFVVSAGPKFQERMTIKQLIRMKMPRMGYIAQVRVIEKAMKVALGTDDIEELPVMPALVGGSFLQYAEESFDNLTNALMGLVGQRILNSIDENMIGVNLEGMTIEQRKMFMGSVKTMLEASKKRAEDAVKSGKPITSRLYHVMPTFSEKQISQISQFNSTSGASSISVEDVLFHAKLLAGSLGIDLSMLGFADLLSGGLGDGGFFRTSAQAAERSRVIRSALMEFFNDVVDLHTLNKYGWVFEPGDRPYNINFYGSISALENETAASRERALNGAAVLVQALDGMKNLGLSKNVMQQMMSKRMEVDDDLAKLIATDLEKSKKEADAIQAGGQFGGGGGFGGDGGQPAKDFDVPQAGTEKDGGDEE